MRRAHIRLLYITWIFLIVSGAYSGITQADVTGSFGVSLSVSAIPCQLLDELGISGFPDQPCEKTFFKADFQTDLNLNITISGLAMGLHSHAGVTGFEDIFLRFATTLGALDIEDEFVFAQPFGIVEAGDGEFIPTCYESGPASGSCLTLFIKKRVHLSLLLAGLTLRSLAIFEDVNFPNPGDLKPTGAIYTAQSQSFGFGTVIRLDGRTSAGISVVAEVGICAEEGANNLKMHTFSFSVNPDCVGKVQTPSAQPLFFGFETIRITGIPIASNSSNSVTLACEAISACTFTDTFTVSGAPIFSLITVSFTLSNILGPIALSDFVLSLQSSPLSLTFNISPALTLTSLSAIGSFTLNPETNPARLSLSASGGPSTGISSLVLTLSILRLGMNFSALSVFTGSGGTLTFSSLTPKITTKLSVLDLESSVELRPRGFSKAQLKATVSF